MSHPSAAPSQHSTEIERLVRQNTLLNQQVRLWARTEKRLYRTQREVETQLARIQALNDFSLAAQSAESDVAVLEQAFGLLWDVLTLLAAVAVIPRPGHPPIALMRAGDGPIEHVELPAGLDLTDLAALGDTPAVLGPAAPQPARGLHEWLDGIARRVELEMGSVSVIESKDVSLRLRGADAKGAPVVLFRSVRFSHHDPAIDETALRYLDLISRQVGGALSVVTLRNDLAQRVADRTADLSRSNAELGASLERLKSTQRQLLEASRLAGMADVATSVLHNVGNVLNSMTVSVSVLKAATERPAVADLDQVAALVLEGDLDAPVGGSGSKRSLVANYLEETQRAAEAHRIELATELDALHANVEHIRATILMQQAHVKTAGVEEEVVLREVIDEAIRLSGGSGGAAMMVRCAPEGLSARLDRHKLLQILVNLIKTAQHAVRDNRDRSAKIEIRVLAPCEERVAIEVEDNGCGIPEETLHKIFTFGFTTKRHGNGFGLHGSACQAGEMRGQLRASSDGADRGARFTLTLPRVPRHASDAHSST